MAHELRDAFDQVRASPELREHTKAWVAQQAQRGAARRRPLGRLVRLVPAACLVLALVGGYQVYATPTVGISIDINPSVELGVNRFGRVVDARGYSPDGQALLEEVPVKHKGYAQAVDDLLGSRRISDLLAQGAAMEVGVFGADAAQAAQVLSGVESCTAGLANAHCYRADPQQVQEAHALGLSCGKYRAYLALRALDPTADPRELQALPMGEIRARIAALSGQEGTAGGGHGAGHGHGAGAGHGHGGRAGAPEG